MEGQKACPNCGKGISPDAGFCLHCGTRVEVNPSFCGHCGTEIKLGAHFCAGCGAARPAPARPPLPLRARAWARAGEPIPM